MLGGGMVGRGRKAGRFEKMPWLSGAALIII